MMGPLELLEATRGVAVGEFLRARTILRVAASTGLAASLSRRGLLEIARSLPGGQNPSLLFRIYAADRPDSAALVYEGLSITWANLWRDITRAAAGLLEAGARPGASVLLVMRNRPEFIVAQNAAALIGCAAVSASFHATAEELSYLAEHSRAAVAIVEHSLRDRVPALVPEIVTVGAESATWPALLRRGARSPVTGATGEPSVVVYTSGTTGKPKGAVRKFPRDSMAGAMRFIEITPMRAGDRHLVVAPLYHSTAYAFATMTLLLGGTVVLGADFEPARFLDDVERHHINTTAVVPTLLHRCLEYLGARGTQPLALPDLRAIFSGGAPLSGALALRVMDRFGDVLFNFYGATETGLVTLATPDDLRHAPGTIGRAVPGVALRFAGADGREVPAGETGELFVKGSLVSEGYLRDDDATRAASQDGYTSVGDLARQDPEGRVFLEGRRRELIISGGVNVYPIEVEHALETHPQIAEAAVVGVPDDEWGERVRAYLVLREQHAPLDHDELRAYMKARLSGAKVPREYVTVGELPRNPTGKVLKARLAREHS